MHLNARLATLTERPSKEGINQRYRSRSIVPLDADASRSFSCACHNFVDESEIRRLDENKRKVFGLHVKC